MNILMMTNTYLPHVGGVARSVEAFAQEYRRLGHRTLIVAPEFDKMPEHETDVVRVPAVQDFQGSGFSLALPIPGILTDTLDEFRPDIVHSHHPYLLGMTAMRVARARHLPLVFTHHTLYEEYTHYVAVTSPGFRRFVIHLATVYANLCEQVIAPSGSLAELLRERGVEQPIRVIPTGIDVAAFAAGRGGRFREDLGIPADAFVVGHLGRLAPEKNLGFLTEAVVDYLRRDREAHLLIGGGGPSAEGVRSAVNAAGLRGRAHFPGVLRLPLLADAYAAMDVFAFTSHSETQGIVLTEAMAAGVPVVGLDAAGVREVVVDRENGRLLRHQATPGEFADALGWLRRLPPADRERLRLAARETARKFSISRTSADALSCYGTLLRGSPVEREPAGQWQTLTEIIKAEWELVKGMAEASRYRSAERERERERDKQPSS